MSLHCDSCGARTHATETVPAEQHLDTCPWGSDEFVAAVERFLGYNRNHAEVAR